MEKQDYINRIIKNNLEMGYSLEDIMADMKSAMQRDLKIELEKHDSAKDFFTSQAGFEQLKNKMGL